MPYQFNPFKTAQVSVGATVGGTLISAANNARTTITVTMTGTTDVYLGESGVTTSTGDLLNGVKGVSKTFSTTAAVYGITSSGSVTVSVLETL